MENGLETEVRHPQPISVRIHHADPDIAAGVTLVEHLFVGDALEGALAWEHNKGTLGDPLGYSPPSAHHKRVTRRSSIPQRDTGLFAQFSKLSLRHHPEHFRRPAFDILGRQFERNASALAQPQMHPVGFSRQQNRNSARSVAARGRRSGRYRRGRKEPAPPPHRPARRPSPVPPKLAASDGSRKPPRRSRRSRPPARSDCVRIVSNSIPIARIPSTAFCIR